MTTEAETAFTCKCWNSYAEHITKLEGHSEVTHLEEGFLTYIYECGESYAESIEKIEKHTYVANVIARLVVKKDTP